MSETPFGGPGANVTANIVHEARTAGAEFVLLDVREVPELGICQIAGNTHIPMNDVPRRHEELPRDQEIVVYCHHGGRSASVANFLLQQGFEKVHNMVGGIHAWATEIEPEMAKY